MKNNDMKRNRWVINRAKYRRKILTDDDIKWMLENMYMSNSFRQAVIDSDAQALGTILLEQIDSRIYEVAVKDYDVRDAPDDGAR